MMLEPPAAETLAEVGLSEDEFSRAAHILGRAPSEAELAVIGVMWSEHCSYKSSKLHLEAFDQGTHPRVVVGRGENAGAVDIGDGLCVVFKMESHNHPSFVSPMDGAATGVGGILRDVFAMGARPVALLNALRFGAVDARLFPGVIEGIHSYANAFGVPTVGGEVDFHESYESNPLVNVCAFGVAQSDQLVFGRGGAGDLLCYLGAKTGPDGLRGATMASAAFGKDAQKAQRSIQVGDAFAGKCLVEAFLECVAADLVVGAQDMGAAGLTSATVELGAKSGLGVDLDLDRVPTRLPMSARDLLLSETQERMIVVLRKENVGSVAEIAARWDVTFEPIGKLTSAHSEFRCTLDHTLCVAVPIQLLTEDAPVLDRPSSPRVRPEITDAQELLDTQEQSDAPVLSEAQTQLDAQGALLKALSKLLSNPRFGARHRIYERFDYLVRGGTVLRPGEGDAAVIRVLDDASGTEKYLAFAVDGNERACFDDPQKGARNTVLECALNLACVGAMPLALTNCLNFASPENPQVMHDFKACVAGIGQASRALDLPVVSGNVSLYNETRLDEHTRQILPTPIIAGVGLVDDPAHIRGAAFVHPGDRIAIVSAPAQECDLFVGAAALIRWLTSTPLSSAHDVSKGGLLLALAECVVLSEDLGATLTLSDDLLQASQDPARVVVSFAPERSAALEAQTRGLGLEFGLIGEVTRDAMLGVTLNSARRHSSYGEASRSELSRARRSAL